MYTPKLFLRDDLPTLHALMRARSFATLIAAMPDGGLDITHLPFLLDDDGPLGSLRAHVARANPIARAAAAGAPMTVVFTGPHSYVSPRWYATPSQQVPTWSYTAVHAHGPSKAMTSSELRVTLDELARLHEADAPDAWRLAMLPEAFVDARLQEIMGFTIAIARLDGKTKLSQNRSAIDHARVIARLRERGGADDLEMVAMMESDPKRPDAP